MLTTSLKRTGAGYFDFYLLHNLGAGRTRFFDEYGIWDYVQEQKAKGVLKHVGFSFHDKAEVLEEILQAHPEMEFVQLQINYADWESDAIQSRACYEVARKYDKPVIIMEPVKGGLLAQPPEPVQKVLKAADPEASCASWALRFAASLPGLITVLSGMSDLSQMDDNLRTFAGFKPLDGADAKVVEQARKTLEAIPAIPCTNCRYCVKGCPMEINIPGIFKAANSLSAVSYTHLQVGQGILQGIAAAKGDLQHLPLPAQETLHIVGGKDGVGAAGRKVGLDIAVGQGRGLQLPGEGVAVHVLGTSL